LSSAPGKFTACNIPVNTDGETIHGKNIVIFARQVINTAEGSVLSGNGADSPPITEGGCSVDKYRKVVQQCGEAVPSRAGNGGNIEIYSTTTINDGEIRSGNGGNSGASHATAIAGNGGLVKIITAFDVDEDNPSYSSVAIVSGDGGQTCANARWGAVPGVPGGTELVIKLLGGTWLGTPGKHLHWDPINLKAMKGLKFSGYSNIDIYTDAGGSVDLTELEDGAISAENIRIQTKALNGSGGTIDLRGVSGKIFTATNKVEIYADDIQTDHNVDIRDLIDAPEVIIGAGRIAYFVSLTSTSLVIGQPNETINLDVRVNNIGPQTDTYNLTAISSEGWDLGSLANVTLKGMEVKTVKLPVTLPSQRGLVDDIKVVATSQTDTSVSKQISLQVMVDAGPDSDGDGYPDSLDAFPDDPLRWLPEIEPEICGQAITYAQNPDTQECKEFTNTCITEGWNMISNEAYEACISTHLDPDDSKGDDAANDTNSKPLNYKSSGHIRDRQGNPVVGVTIQVGDKVTTTDENGYWEIVGLEENSHTVVASKDGYTFKPVEFVASHNTPDVAVEISAPSSALAVAIEQMPTVVLEGEPVVTYAIEVKNNGHVTATGISLLNTLPADVTAVQAETEGGTCSYDGASSVNCNLLDLPVGESWVVHVHVKPIKSGTLVNRVVVNSNEYPQNNATRQTYVRPHFSVSSWVRPYPAMLNGNMLYHLNVLNGKYSPAAAEDVSVSLNLPAGVSFVSAELENGNCQHSNNVVTCNLNPIAVDSAEKIVITATALHGGMQTHRIIATASSFAEVTFTGNVNVVSPNVPGAVDLAFVVDTTGSMQDDIDAVIAALVAVIQDIETNNQNAPMVGLIEFKDDIVKVTTTDDLRQIIRELQAIVPGGGNDRFYCPEASVQAMAKAVELTTSDGRIILVTDASPHPDTSADEALAAMQAKNVTFDTFLSGDCVSFELGGSLADRLTRRNTRSDIKCDLTAEDEVASARQVYSCMTGQTGGMFVDAEAIKLGDANAVDAYLAQMLQILHQVVSKVNPVTETPEDNSGSGTTPIEPVVTAPVVVTPKTPPVDGNGALLPPPVPDTHWVFVGSPNGRVVSQPAGIDCNQGQGECFAYFKTGTKLKLIPTAPEGLFFAGWHGDIGCEKGEFTVTGMKGCNAKFYGLSSNQ
jgi:uncharacterized repeat protein (TIGR01451 family)